jgi:nucleotide-binding universal stress UspA family protein
MLTTAQPFAAAQAPARGGRAQGFKRILVAIDGGPSSADAVATAVRLAAALGAKLALVHCIDTAALVAMPPDRCQGAMDEAMKRGSAVLAKLASLVPPELPHEAILRDGPAVEEILAAADGWNADFIVLGSRGLGRLGRFIRGSTAEAVMEHATRPVMVVTHQGPGEAVIPRAEPERPEYLVPWF